MELTKRKWNGANNPNARFDWKEVSEIKRKAERMPRYGRTTKLAKMYKTSRFAIWQILSGRTYLLNPPKKKPSPSINSLVSYWVGV